MVFKKNATFLPKIAEKCDHNINLRLGEFSPNGRFEQFKKNLKGSPHFYATDFFGVDYVSIVTKNYDKTHLVTLLQASLSPAAKQV
jgi:hypothetical protein